MWLANAARNRRSWVAILPSHRAEAPDRAHPRRVHAPSCFADDERARADLSPLRQPATATAQLRDHTPPAQTDLPASARTCPSVDLARPIVLRDTLAVTGVDSRGTRVIVADDDVLMREGIASLLGRSGYEIVGQAGDGSELMRLVGEQQPALAVVDIRMPPAHRTEGLEAAQAIREQFPETALLILSAHVEVEHAMTLLASGRRTGYLLKSRVTDVDEFLDAVGRVSRGGSVVDPALVQELVAARDVEDPLEELTSR